MTLISISNIGRVQHQFVNIDLNEFDGLLAYLALPSMVICRKKHAGEIVSLTNKSQKMKNEIVNSIH